jgi:PHS family inorganic phosphate transporter-like MFS transporter
MSTTIGIVKLPFATKFTLQSIIGAVANLVGQYNFTSVSVAVLLFKQEYGHVPQWALSSMNSAVFGGRGSPYTTLRSVGFVPAPTRRCTCSSLLTADIFLGVWEYAWAQTGAVVGMLTIGYVGDIVGRRRAMAITLTIMILGAFGSCSLTWGDETAVYILLSVFRFVMGIGIGGVYPLSASASYENDLAAGGDYGQRLRNVAWTAAWMQPGQMVPFLFALILFGTFYTRYCASQYVHIHNMHFHVAFS